MNRNIVLIAHNLRSCHNVGSLLRTADGLGVKKVYLTGYTPYPHMSADIRLPHIAMKIHKQISKTALGAEQTIAWQHATDITRIIKKLKHDGYVVVGLEQTPASFDITAWPVPSKIALIAGRETEGIEPEVLELCDLTAEIPMFGKKESFNVVQAAAMALFYCTFFKP